MPEPSLAQQHPTEVLSTLVGAFTVVGALVTILYNRINKDISSMDQKHTEDYKQLNDRLELGSRSFIEIGEKLVSIGSKLKFLEDSDKIDIRHLELVSRELGDLQDRVIILETEHKDCRDQVKQLSGHAAKNFPTTVIARSDS